MTVYILAIKPPLHHARYYVGWCKDDNLANRLHQHTTGQGAFITRAAVAKGHRLVMVACMDGDRKLERAIKNLKNTPRFVEKIKREGAYRACLSLRR